MAYTGNLAAKITIFQAKKTEIPLLLVKKVTILVEYSDFADLFSKKLAEILSK